MNGLKEIAETVRTSEGANKINLRTFVLN
jgi:hypothetical protein